MTTDLMSIRVAAQRLGVSVKTLHRMCAAGKISFYLVGSRRKFSEANIAAYLADRRTFPAEPDTNNKSHVSSLGAL